MGNFQRLISQARKHHRETHQISEFRISELFSFIQNFRILLIQKRRTDFNSNLSEGDLFEILNFITLSIWKQSNVRVIDRLKRIILILFFIFLYFQYSRAEDWRQINLQINIIFTLLFNSVFKWIRFSFKFRNFSITISLIWTTSKLKISFYNSQTSVLIFVSILLYNTKYWQGKIYKENLKGLQSTTQIKLSEGKFSLCYIQKQEKLKTKR